MLEIGTAFFLFVTYKLMDERFSKGWGVSVGRALSPVGYWLIQYDMVL